MSAKNEISKFIEQQNALSTLRYITCGSVDDGKSTLLGRMLYEAQLIFDDQVDSLISDSKRLGTNGENIDFALLVDGLAAEREQGITIDVAYRFFSTKKRKFIVADSPGHEQYTRNMVTAASNAELAIILIDARNGIMPQTKRHSFIANLVGIKNVIVAVNKMDLISFDEKKYKKIVEAYLNEVSSKLNFLDISFIPVSALNGDNIVKKSESMSWYKGSSLIKLLENAETQKAESSSFSMSVQNVNRPNLNFRGYSGTVSSGAVKIDDELQVSGSKQTAQVKEIYIGDNLSSSCSEGDSVTLTINKEIDISRGDILHEKNFSYSKNSKFLTNIIWFSPNKCYPNRSYLIQSANKKINCKIEKIKNKINVNNFEKISAGFLEMNDIGQCEISTDSGICLLPYDYSKTFGNFILIDKATNLTVGAGTVRHELRRSSNVTWQSTEVDRKSRQNILNQDSYILWFTGLSGSGKSTVANIIEKKLAEQGKLTYLLDGDNLRHGLNRDLGFKKEDRIENLRRAGEVAKLLHDTGVIVIASFISPYEKDRKNIRELFPEGEFIEIFVDAKMETLQSRDPKGLYKKAMEGKIPNFTGIGSEYERPKKPEIVIQTDNIHPEESAEIIMEYIEKKDALRNK